MSLKSFPGVFEVTDGHKKVRDDVRWLGEPLGSFKLFFHNWTSGSTWAPGPPKLTFDESKRCQFLFILSMGQDGVFKKNPNFTHLENEHFLGTPCMLK